MNYSRSDLTVVLCTANRKELAESFIDDFRSKFSGIHLLVVENSPDSTIFDHISSRYAKYSDFIEIIRSVPSGLSRARNLAASIVGTPLVAFTDDDCLLDPNWINQILKSGLWIEVDALGGRIDPIFPSSTAAASLSQDVLASLAILNLGNKPKILHDNEFFYGANMVFKKSVFSLFRFKETLGRIGDSLLSGEEVELQNNMNLNGLKRGYDPSIRVNHIISEDRLNLEWFVSRFAWQGVSDVATQDSSHNSWMSDALHVHAKNIQIEDAVDKLLNPSVESLEDSLKVSRYLIFSLLTRDTSSTLQSLPHQYTKIRKKFQFNEPSKYAPISASAKILAIDFLNFHDFIFESVDSMKIAFHFIAGKPWEMTKKQVEAELGIIALTSLSSIRLDSIVFGSLDSFLHRTYFEAFQEFIRGNPLNVTACLHRIPNFEELDNLRKIQGNLTLVTYSQKLQKALLSSNIPSIYSPLPMRYPRISRKLPTKKIVICFPGEIRSITLTGFICDVAEYIERNSLEIELRILGSTKNLELHEKILRVKEICPSSLNLDFFGTYKEKFRNVLSATYHTALEQSDYIVKIQSKEEAFAASAVVADAMSIGARIVVLERTESANATELYASRVVLSNLKPEHFISAIESDYLRNSLESDDAISKRRVANNETFFSTLFGEED